MKLVRTHGADMSLTLTHLLERTQVLEEARPLVPLDPDGIVPPSEGSADCRDIEPQVTLRGSSRWSQLAERDFDRREAVANQHRALGRFNVRYNDNVRTELHNERAERVAEVLVELGFGFTMQVA